MLKMFLHREVDAMQLNEAVSRRLLELLRERDMTQYQLNMKSGVPKSSISNVINIDIWCSMPPPPKLCIKQVIFFCITEIFN